MTETELLDSCEKFFRVSGYDKLERDRLFQGPKSSFVSPLVGTKKVEDDEVESLVTYLRSKIEKYDNSFQSSVETALFDISDNYEGLKFLLTTDSKSYWPITTNPELNVAFENLMDEGMALLLLNGKSGYAMFDDFSKLAAPIAITD